LKEITMKNALKTLRVALASTALISVFAPTAQAEDFSLTFNGNITAVTCTIGLYTAATGGAATNQLILPNVPVTTLNGAPGTVAGTTAFYVGVPAGCASTGVGLTTFNTGFSSPTQAGGRANNTGTATGLTVDLTSTPAAGLRSIVLGANPPASSAAATNQTGLAAVTLGNRQAFAARYYKTVALATDVTAGTVVSGIVATGYYPCYKPSFF